MMNGEMLLINDKMKLIVIVSFKIVIKSQFIYHTAVFVIKTLKNSQAAILHKIECSHTE